MAEPANRGTKEMGTLCGCSRCPVFVNAGAPMSGWSASPDAVAGLRGIRRHSFDSGTGTVWYAGRGQGTWPWTFSAARCWVLRVTNRAKQSSLGLPVIWAVTWSTVLCA